MRTVSAIMIGAAITVAALGSAHAGALDDRQGQATIVSAITGAQPSDSPRRPVAMPENSGPAQATPLTPVTTDNPYGTVGVTPTLPPPPPPPPPPGS
jgi:hypothetical protein